MKRNPVYALPYGLLGSTVAAFGHDLQHGSRPIASGFQLLLAIGICCLVEWFQKKDTKNLRELLELESEAARFDAALDVARDDGQPAEPTPEARAQHERMQRRIAALRTRFGV